MEDYEGDIIHTTLGSTSKKREITEGTEEVRKKRKHSVKADESSDSCGSDNDSGSDSDDASQPVKKEKKEELPTGYICNACKQPGHAIYNCPMKVSRKRKEKKLTLFISRLPKTWDRNNFKDFLSGEDIDMNSVVNTKMVMKEGGGDAAFSGVVLLTVEGNAALSKVLQLNGHSIRGRDIIVKMNEPQQKKKPQHCARCGGSHDIATCTNPRMCYRCRGNDHISSECPKKKQESYGNNKNFK